MSGLSVFNIKDYLGPGAFESWREDFGGTFKFRIVLPAVVLSVNDADVCRIGSPHDYVRTISDKFKVEVEAIVIKQFKEQLEEHRRLSAAADWARLVGGGHDG